VPNLQALAKGPVLLLAQTPHTVHALHRLVPATRQLPVIAVPHNRADGSLDDGSMQLGGAWQPGAVEHALTRYLELSPWWLGRLELARCLEICNHIRNHIRNHICNHIGRLELARCLELAVSF
jgi:hypothetical protein